ncbi:hypothetical protein FA95DRAFT_909914 [Auriscalpium vulgare]|uniref:Uncharacterized protein n=1 Tax=Auriscalpium vulgare TaxID=40419 RepID=A0ACB8R9F9_9AGAM|nr:hypothetical protein FA95DRAFT_909914 [Auriscalpium vulgare]
MIPREKLDAAISHAPSFKCSVYHKIEDAFTAWALIRFPLLAHTTFGVMWNEPPDVIRFTKHYSMQSTSVNHGPGSSTTATIAPPLTTADNVLPSPPTVLLSLPAPTLDVDDASAVSPSDKSATAATSNPSDPKPQSCYRGSYSSPTPSLYQPPAPPSSPSSSYEPLLPKPPMLPKPSPPKPSPPKLSTPKLSTPPLLRPPYRPHRRRPSAALQLIFICDKWTVHQATV